MWKVPFESLTPLTKDHKYFTCGWVMLVICLLSSFQRFSFGRPSMKLHTMKMPLLFSALLTILNELYRLKWQWLLGLVVQTFWVNFSTKKDFNLLNTICAVTKPVCKAFFNFTFSFQNYLKVLWGSPFSFRYFKKTSSWKIDKHL